MRNKWDSIYKSDKKRCVSSLNSLLRVMPVFKSRRVKRILDIGCGSGRHSIYLAKKGFKVVGIDISEEAIMSVRRLANKEKANAEFLVGRMEKLPFKDEEFDGLISLRVLNHGRRKDVEMAINEIFRVLKKGGIGFISVIKILGRKRTLGVTKINGLPVKIIESYTYVPLEGKEKGIVHFSFNKKTLLYFFKKFKIKRIWLEKGSKSWEKYYCVLFEK